MPVPRSQNEEWSAFLLNSLDKGLDFFGASTKRVVYWNFEEKYRLKRDTIPDHVPEFASSLRAMFGAGTTSLVKSIAKEMSMTYHFEFRETDDLVSVVSKARKEYRNNSDKE